MGDIRITPAKPCVLTVVMGNVRHWAVRAASLKRPDVDTALAAIAVLASVGLLSAFGLSARSSSGDGYRDVPASRPVSGCLNVILPTPLGISE